MPSADPRTEVTPDAFQVSPALLGLPLASPRRRLAAIVIDLVVVGLLTVLGWRVLGLLAGTAFFSLSLKRPPPERAKRAFRWSWGCLGAVIIFAIVVTSGTVMSSLLSRLASRSSPVAESPAGESDDPETGLARLATLAASAGRLTAFRSAETAEEARAEVLAAIAYGRDLGLSFDEIRGVMEGAAPDDAEWDPLAVIEEAFREIEGADAETPRPEPVSLERALAEYTALVSGPDSTVDARARAALETRLIRAMASDTLARLQGAVTEVRGELEDSRERNRALREELDEAESGGLFGWLLNTVDQLGLTFGWAALYFAFLLTWFDGLTPGKRLLGIRVKRLDGGSMTWLLAFERSGGYAAGFATGLLGFAQILWDANRQAIHDRIAGTVVIRDGLTKPPATGTPHSSTRTA